MRSKRGDNVIDENLIFGIIGISDSISTMVYGEITVNPTGSLYAGVRIRIYKRIIHNIFFHLKQQIQLNTILICILQFLMSLN